MAKQVKPDLTLNMDEKIYLAVNQDTAGKLAFVYTLACLPTGTLLPTQFNLMPTREIHAFKNKESAELYHNTIARIVEINAMDESKNIIFETNEALIKKFKENVR